VHAREQSIGRVAAHARLARLSALAFHTMADVDGSAVSITDTTTDLTVDPPGRRRLLRNRLTWLLLRPGRLDRT